MIQLFFHSSESRVQFKDEHDDHVDESVPLEALPANQSREKRRSSGVRMKGHLISSFEVASSKTSKPGKGSVFDVSSVPEENQDSHHSTTKTTRKKQKMQVSKVRNACSFSFIADHCYKFDFWHG